MSDWFLYFGCTLGVLLYIGATVFMFVKGINSENQLELIIYVSIATLMICTAFTTEIYILTHHG